MALNFSSMSFAQEMMFVIFFLSSFLEWLNSKYMVSDIVRKSPKILIKCVGYCSWKREMQIQFFFSLLEGHGSDWL